MSTSLTIVPRSEHTVSRADISDNALKVLYRLHNAGYRANLVGGCVRDLLLSRNPKDFDVATDASPEAIKKLFDNCRLIGRRFRLAHILFGRDVIEVATFRAQDAEDSDERLNSASGMILRDNVYGEIEEDVWRRDFTVNALYYNIADFSLIDYVGGMQDIRAGMIRLIGDADTRYHEDPVRMLRALRFAAKLDFEIEASTAEPIKRLGSLLADISPARLFDEVVKLFQSGAARKTFEKLEQYDLLRYLFPATAECLRSEEYRVERPLILSVLDNTDARIQQGKSVTPAFLYAAFLWWPLLRVLRYTPDRSWPNVTEIQKAATKVMERQSKCTAVPRRFTAVMREIWGLQPRLHRYKGMRALRLLMHPRFRAAYDFLQLRAAAGESYQGCVDWWTDLMQKSPTEQQQMVQESSKQRRPHKKNRRRPSRKRARHVQGA